jgi:serine/threonine-protein kinase ATR
MNIQGILVALEATDQLSEILHPSFSVNLPPSDSISDFWPDSQHIVALPQRSQRAITSQLQAILLGLRFVHIILDSTQSTGQWSAVPSATEAYLPWALDGCLALWQRYRQCATHLERTNSHDEIEAAFLQVLNIVALPIMTPENELSRSPKVMLSFTTRLSDLVQTCSISPLSKPNQIRLASLLIRLRSFLEQPRGRGNARRHYRDLRTLVIDHLEITIGSFCQAVKEHKPLERDLQVNYSSVLTCRAQMLTEASSRYACGFPAVTGRMRLRS